MNGRLTARAERWKDVFVTRPRAAWIERLRAVGVACEPVLGPGGALADPHLAEIGLAVTTDEDGHHDVLVGPPRSADPHGRSPNADRPADGNDRSRRPRSRTRLLEGVKVADFSAFVAGPLAAEVLADLGAEVVKVEPPAGRGDACRRLRASPPASGASAAWPSTSAPPRPDRSSTGCSSGPTSCCTTSGSAWPSDSASTTARVAAVNPGAVYCHARPFGPSDHGRRCPATTR